VSEHYKPDGWPAVVPRIITDDVPGLVAFVKTVFGAQGELETQMPTELRIADSIVLVSDGGGVRSAQPSFFYVYVPDVDATFERALAAGATVLEPPAAMPWGDRRATFEDRWGNLWQAATVGG